MIRWFFFFLSRVSRDHEPIFGPSVGHEFVLTTTSHPQGIEIALFAASVYSLVFLVCSFLIAKSVLNPTNGVDRRTDGLKGGLQSWEAGD